MGRYPKSNRLFQKSLRPPSDGDFLRSGALSQASPPCALSQTKGLSVHTDQHITGFELAGNE